MLRMILVPLDGSPLAERALPLTTGLARAAGARVLLLRAASAVRTPDQPDAVALATAELQAVAERVRADGIEAEPYVYQQYYEEIGDIIVSVARERQADLVVMSTHGRGGLGRWLYGSVADRALRQMDVPVLLVPPTAEPSWPTGRPPRILLPLDGSDFSREAIGPATELARALGAQLRLFSVVETPSYSHVEGYPYVGFDLEAELAAAEEELERIAAGIRPTVGRVEVGTVYGSPAARIAAEARERESDLIVMATHGRGGLARFILGSVATATLQRAAVPLLLVRPVGIRESAQPTEENAATASAPSPAAVSTVTMTFSQAELELIARGLGELLYLPERDPEISAPVRTLLSRVRQARVGSGDPVSVGSV